MRICSKDTKDVDGATQKAHKPTRKQLDAAVAVIEALSGEWDPHKHKDRYHDRLKRVVDRKRTGETIKAPRRAEEPSPCPDLMAAPPRPIRRLVTLQWVVDIALSTQRGLPPGGLERTTSADHGVCESLGNFVGYRTLGGGGLLSDSGVLRVTLSRAGRVDGARWISIRLVDGLPRPDPARASARLVAALSRQDFPADHFVIEPSGRFRLPHEAGAVVRRPRKTRSVRGPAGSPA